MKVLVTGGCGFIGSNLANCLANLDYETHVMDISGSPAVPLPGQVEIHEGSITDKEALEEAMSGCEIVFHEAAQISVADSINNPKKTQEINADGTRNILEECREQGVKKLVLASSAAVYGDEPGLPKRETDKLKPTSPYGESKLQNELDAKRYFEEYELETVCLRYFNVYGPGQSPNSPYSGVISRFLDCAINNIPPTIYGNGNQTRDFVFVEDVVQANVLAAEGKELGGQVFNVASGKETSLMDLWRTIKSISGCRLEPKFEPRREGDIWHSVASIEKAKERLGYQPKISLEEGLKRTYSEFSKA